MEFTNQQGDLLFFRVESMPETVEKEKPQERGFVLAEGEATGHAHCVEASPHVKMFKDKKSETIYMEITQDSVLTHEEHNNQVITPGKYRIGRVVEVDPFEDEIRQVAD